jgi:hypothetical protein
MLAALLAEREVISVLAKDQTPLGAEFEKVWDDNVERLYEK